MQLRTSLRGLAFLAAVAVLSAGCSGDSKPTASDGVAVVSSVVPLDGGTVSASGVTVNFGSGSLSNASQVELRVGDPVQLDDGSLPPAVTAIGPRIEVSLDAATLRKDVTITIALPSAPKLEPTDQPVVIWQDGAGGYVLLPTSWSEDHTSVTASLDHFSFGFLGKIDANKIAGPIADWFKGLVTGRANAAQPSCGDEAGPRAQGLNVVSDSGDLVRWCAGNEQGKLVVKVANNWSAPAEVEFPRTWTVVDYHGAGASLQAPYDWLNSQTASRSRLARIVGAGDTITLSPDVAGPGLRGSVEVRESIGSWAWAAALQGIDVYFATVGKLLSLSKDDVEKAKAVLATVQFTKCYTDNYGQEADPTQVVNSSAAVDLAKAAKFGLTCGIDTIKEYLRQRGANRLLIAAVGIVAGIVGTVVGLVQSLFAGIRALPDQLSSLFDSRIGGVGSGYTIQTSWAANQTAACAEPTRYEIGPGVVVTPPTNASVRCEAGWRMIAWIGQSGDGIVLVQQSAGGTWATKFYGQGCGGVASRTSAQLAQVGVPQAQADQWGSPCGPPPSGSSSDGLPADLRNVLLPAGVCQSDAPAVQLRSGSARNTSQVAQKNWGDPAFFLSLSSSEIRSDLTGDGRQDVAVVLACQGYGGTNNSFVHIIVLTSESAGLKLLGDLQPNTHGVGVGGATIALQSGRLRSTDSTYRSTDPRCCPTGRGFTEWTWTGTRFEESASG